MRYLASLCLVCLFVVGCGVPTGIQTPQGKAAYRADQVVTRLGEFQNAVIDAGRANKLTQADARAIVAWISGDVRATPPVTGAIDVLNTAPQGAKATLEASWATVRPRVLANPTLASWAPIIDSLLQGLQ